MKCFVCKDGQSNIVTEDQIPCKCGDIINVYYHLCTECGSVWKTIDDELLEGSLLSTEDIDGMLDDMDSFFIDSLEEVEKFTTLGGYIHKCLDCGALCYESSKGKYICSSCGFEWESIDCG